MKICVLYDSVTGNTRMLAEVIEKKYAALLTENPAEADVVFLGSWTDKGSFSEKMKEQAEKIQGKKVFIFGTCGFGGNPEYYERLFERAAALLDESNTVIGHYYCQGKMPMAVKDRYRRTRSWRPAFRTSRKRCPIRIGRIWNDCRSFWTGWNWTEGGQPFQMKRQKELE